MVKRNFLLVSRTYERQTNNACWVMGKLYICVRRKNEDEKKLLKKYIICFKEPR